MLEQPGDYTGLEWNDDWGCLVGGTTVGGKLLTGRHPQFSSKSKTIARVGIAFRRLHRTYFGTWYQVPSLYSHLSNTGIVHDIE